MPEPLPAEGLRFGPFGPGAVHLCIDMQRLFGPEGPWAVPWAVGVLPRVEALCRHDPARTIFTRFLPVQSPRQARGTWRRYYEKWDAVTLDRIDPALVDLLPELAGFSPPARVIDKVLYSPWSVPDFDAMLRRDGVNTLLISGGETDICVLAAVLGAIDRGYRTILVSDAVCSSDDIGHDNTRELFRRRFERQCEVAGTEEVLESRAART